MSTGWPQVKLGELLRRSEEIVDLQPDAEYRELTVKLWGKGVVLRGVVTGAGVAASRRLVVRKGQFIFSRIDARNGALGIVPEELDGAIVSNDFPAFDVVTDRLLLAYLGWICRTASFVDVCRAASEGTTNRVRMQEDKFLASTIPLPPLAEQKRIVARIEELAAQIAEVCALRQQAVEETETIMAAEEHKVWPDASLGDARTLESLTVFLARGRQSKQGESAHFLIKTRHVQQDCYVPTMLRLAPHVAAKVKPDALVRDGDILIACSAAGCLGRVARYRDKNRIVSTDTHVAIARANPDLVEPDYLYVYLRGAQGQHQLRSRERGDWKREKVGFRLTELNLSDLKKVPVPALPLSEQRRIVAKLDALQTEVDKLKRLQAETAAELDALLPSILDKAFKGELTAADGPPIEVMAAAPVEPRKLKKVKPRKPTPYKDDGAVICLLVRELQALGRPTDEYTIQKHAYAGKEIWRLPINSGYARKAGGPWSHELRDKVLFYLDRKNMLREERGQFVPAWSFDKSLAHAEVVLGEEASRIRDLVEYLKDFGPNGLERWMTVLMAARDLAAKSEPVTNVGIQTEIDSWPGKRMKEIFSEESVDDTIAKMVRRGWIQLAPSGG